ncbi:MAG TPA: hypothetical protein VNO69_04865 [Methyloceanibacter sp.]|nr:hypothetical protein [Methyloceanibacter sp.]
MAGFWGLVLAALIGSFAWVYQKAWDRQQARIASYQQIVDMLPGFTVRHLDADKIDAALNEVRRLWLFAPDDVVRAGNAFLATIRDDQSSTDEVRERVLADFVLAMRRDASFTSSLWPRFFRTSLSAKDVRLQSAARRKNARR